MQGNGGKIRQWTLVWQHTKLVNKNFEGKVTIWWNKKVQTDRSIPNNKPDIIIHDNEKGTCVLIDVANLGDICD